MRSERGQRSQHVRHRERERQRDDLLLKAELCSRQSERLEVGTKGTTESDNTSRRRRHQEQRTHTPDAEPVPAAAPQQWQAHNTGQQPLASHPCSRPHHSSHPSRHKQITPFFIKNSHLFRLLARRIHPLLAHVLLLPPPTLLLQLAALLVLGLWML